MATATLAPATSAPTLLTLEQYLHTAYHPDVDFVDGQIEERNMGELQHSLLQGELVFWFNRHRAEWNIRVVPELRTRVAEDRIRIPDVTVFLNDAARTEQVRVTPALIAIEVLSPDDRLPRVMVRLQDFARMGVPNIWLMDAVERVAYTFANNALRLVEGPRLALADSPIHVDLEEIFRALD